ncbi:NACHT domain-containing protein [Streptomyces erythrochromogenes]|uniref:NACHT domain-containing protein n=1 Tax=Streptomyces erythrochromogenes TaxID=285574 RepID=UPI003812A4F1
MEDTTARERLAAELRHLVAAAGLPLSGIAARAETRKPVVKLGKSKLSGWLSGTCVPEADEPFRHLVRLLEPRAHDRSGLRPRGEGWWLGLRQKAADERSAARATTPGASRGRSAPAPEHRPVTVRRSRPRRSVLLGLASYFARAVERAGVPHYLPTGLDPVVLDQPRFVRPSAGRGRRESWEKATAAHPRIVLLADAGLGKTWLLRLHARRLAEAALVAPVPPGDPGAPPVPVLLRCGDLACRTELLLTDALAGHLADLGVLAAGDRAEVERAAADGRFVLLLDAYDELPGPQDRARWYALLSTAPPALPIVVAGRRAGHPGPPPTAGGPQWQELVLEPFDREAVVALVRSWPLTSAARASVFERVRTPGLGEVPLLLALLCALAEEITEGVADGAPDLPAAKGELYERMLRRFLVHEQRPPAAEDIEADRLLDLLGPVAFHFAHRSEGGWRDVMPREEVLRALRTAGPAFTELRRDAAGVLRTLSVEAGVLQPLGDPGGGRAQPYLFLHRSFAEYLTARHLTGLPEAEALAALDQHLADGGRWDDTLAMLGRLVLLGRGPARFGRLLSHLADRPGGVLHAVRMLGEAGEAGGAVLEPGLEGRMVEVFRRAVADDTEAAARAVATCRALPDALVDVLAGYLAEHAAADLDEHYGQYTRLVHLPQDSVTRLLGRVAASRDPLAAISAVRRLDQRPGPLPLRTLLSVLRVQTETGLHPSVFATLARALCERGEPASVVAVLESGPEPPSDAAVRAVLDALGVAGPAGS